MERENASLTHAPRVLPIVNLSPLFRAASFFVYYGTLCLVVLFDHLAFAVRIVGRENLRSVRGILVSNHTLYLDPGLISHAIAARRTYFTAMEQTFRRPVLGAYIRLLGAFPLPKNSHLLRVRLPLRKAFAHRGLVHFFPEGELYHLNQDIREFSDGAFFFAAMLDVPVIPIAIVVRPRAWGKRLRVPLPPRVVVRICPPSFPSQFGIRGIRDRGAIAAMRDSVRAGMIRAMRETGRADR